MWMSNPPIVVHQAHVFRLRPCRQSRLQVSHRIQHHTATHACDILFLGHFEALLGVAAVTIMFKAHFEAERVKVVPSGVKISQFYDNSIKLARDVRCILCGSF
jgi:hypothetical protein